MWSFANSYSGNVVLNRYICPTTLNTMISKYSILAAILLIVLSCTRDSTPLPDTSDCMTENITYSEHIESILSASCALSGCHLSGDNSPRLDGFVRAQNAADTPSFIGSIRHEGGFTAMPFPAGTARLELCDILTIEAWIAAGSPQ